MPQMSVRLHVRDISHPDSENQKSDVMCVLNQMGINDGLGVPIIEVRNKVDCLDPSAKEYQINQVERSNKSIILASAKTGEGVKVLLNLLDTLLNRRSKILEVRLPWKDGKTLAWLYKRGHVIKRHDGNENVELTVKLDPEDAARLERRLLL